MKKSNILFITAIVITTTAMLFPSYIGSITITTDNEVKGPISKLWQRIYNIKLTNELPNSIKHIRVVGGISNFNLRLEKDSTNSKTKIFSTDPLSFTFKTEKDTLLLYPKNRYALVNYTSNSPLESVTADGSHVSLIGLKQDHLTINAKNNSSIDINTNPWYNREHTDWVGSLRINASDSSKIEFSYIRMHKATATLNNAVINYNSSTYIDSLAVNLTGKSTLATFQEDGGGIKYINITGDKKYFKKEFLKNRKAEVKIE